VGATIVKQGDERFSKELPERYLMFDDDVKNYLRSIGYSH
jgi:hypothetical protein